MADLVDMLREIQAAEVEAVRLRGCYGDQAQLHCERLLRALPDGDPRKPSLSLVRKALGGLH